MPKSVIHAIVLIQNWGESSRVVNVLKNDTHTSSIYQIMGSYSYLIDANFDDSEQLAEWIIKMKSIKLTSGIPAILAMQTQRIIEINKQKENYSLQDYLDMDGLFHFFVRIDNPHHDSELLDFVKKSAIISSVLHVQGDNSFTIEVIADDYAKYREFLKGMKQVKTIHHIETNEVVSVLKYRNQILDEKGALAWPDKDIREIYTL